MKIITATYHTYILIDGPFGINFEVHSTCRLQDDVDLVAQDGLRSVQWVFLAHIICNNSRDDGAAENFVVEPLGKV